MLQLEFLDYDLGQIMGYFANEWVVGWVLIITGIIAAAWLLETITDPIPILGSIFDIIKVLSTYLGFFVGALDILVGYVVWVTQPDAVIVAGVLILAGFSLTMRILSKFPLGFVFALAAAIFVTFTIYGMLAPYVADPFVGEYVSQIISLKWMAVIGVIVFAIAYSLGGFLLSVMSLLGKIFSSTPISILVGLACIGVGIVVLVMPDLVGIVLPWVPPPLP